MIYPFIALGLLIALWAIFAAVVNIELIVPSIGSTFKKLGKILSDAEFYKSLWGTSWRSVVSFLIGTVSAFLFSLVSIYRPIRLFLSPMIKIARAIPTMSIILLTVIWLSPTTSPILIAFLINFPIMYAGFFSAIDGVDKDLVEMSRAYKVPIKKQIFSLYIPQILPTAFDTMQSSLSLTVKIVISAEVIAQTKESMGVMMQLARGYLETAELLAWTLVAVVLCYLFEGIIFGIKKLVVRWK